MRLLAGLTHSDRVMEGLNPRTEERRNEIYWKTRQVFGHWHVYLIDPTQKTKKGRWGVELCFFRVPTPEEAYERIKTLQVAIPEAVCIEQEAT